MAMTPERISIRVELLIESIRGGMRDAFAEHNAALTIDYVEQVYRMGIINEAQFTALVIAVNEAADNWEPSGDANGLPLEHTPDS